MAAVNFSVCQPRTATTAQETCASSAAPQILAFGSGCPARMAGFTASRSISSWTLFDRATTWYFRGCRTRNPSASRYSRTIASFTDDIATPSFQQLVQVRGGDFLR